MTPAASTAVPIKILLLEDDPSDAELIQNRLGTVGLPLEFRVAGGREEFVRALDESLPDILLADYFLPGFDAIEALSILRERGSDLPVILVTGSQGEEVAVRCLREGAHDYILKDRMERLPDAIYRAIVFNRTRRERAEADRALKESERRFRDLADNLPEIVFETDARGVFTFVNPVALRLTGYTPEDLARGSKGILDLLLPGVHGSSAERMAALLRGEEVGAREYQVIRKDGTSFPAIVHPKAIVREGEVVGFRGIVVDISERKEAEAALFASERLFRDFFERNPAASYIASAGGQIITCNPAFLDLFGFSSMKELEAFPLDRLYGEEGGRDLFLEHIRKQRGVNLMEANYLHRSGKPLSGIETAVGLYDGQGHLTGVMGFIMDLTSHRELEARLLQAQKMEAVGRLAGGIAHDFNNILTTILTFAELTAEPMQPDSQGRRGLEQIQTAAKRAAQLTAQLLAYSRQQVFEMKSLNLRECAESTLKLFSRVLGEGIAVELVAPEDLWPVRGDEGQVDQVIMNLVVNARDAMENGGKLTVELLNGQPLRPGADTPEKPSPMVIMKVTDTGTGMEESVLARIFDPYFTTKGREKGTGLGLSVVEGIVRQHGGSIEVASEPGRGSTVTVTFPAATAPSDPQGEEISGVRLRGTETILLVEDEEGVREATREALESLGYGVVTANNAAHALQVFEVVGDGVDLVLSDMIMPGGVSGRTLCEGLKRRKPGMKTLIMSGHTDDVLLREGVSTGELAFLHKPFSKRALGAAVRRCLDE